MRTIVGAAFLLMIAIASDAHALTPVEAQTLSIAELAKRVLGEAGSDMLDVDRPDWGPAPPNRFQPPLNRLTFYGRAETAGFFDNPICRATVVTLDFDQNGDVTGFQTETRYGLEGPIDPPQGSWSYDNTVQACAVVASTRSYFAAPNASAAVGAARFRARTGTNATAPLSSPAIVAFDANPITAAEAQMLSVQDLARRVLGEAGADMQDVERPEWGAGALPAPPDFIRLPQFRGTPWTPSEPPPLGQLIFYGRAHSADVPNNPLCRAIRVTVRFDQNGAVTQLQSETRYGLEGPIDLPPGSWSRENTVQACAVAPSTKFYLPASDVVAAVAIARVRAAVVSEARAAGPVSFSLLCPQSIDCDNYVRPSLERLDTTEWTATRIVSCPEARDSVVVTPECYELRRDGCFRSLLRVTGGFDAVRQLIIRSVYGELGACIQDPVLPPLRR